MAGRRLGDAEDQGGSSQASRSGQVRRQRRDRFARAARPGVERLPVPASPSAALVLDVGRLPALGSPLADVLNATAREVARLLGADRVLVRLVDWDDQPESVVAWPSELIAPEVEPPTLNELLSDTRPARGRLGNKDARPGRPSSGPPQQAGERFWLRYPLRVAGRLVGCLLAVSRPGRSFHRIHLRSVGHLVRQVAVTIENHRQFQQATARAERMRQLAEMSRLASESLDAQRVRNFVVQATAELLNADLATLWLMEETRDSLELAAASGRGMVDALAATDEVERRISLSGSLIGEVAATGRSYYAPSPARDLGQPTPPPGWFNPARSQLVVPLLTATRSIGALAISHRYPRRFASDEIQMLEAFVAQAVTAIENARLYGEVSRRRDQAEAMAEIARATASSLELHEVLDLALEKIMEIMAVPSGIMYLRDESTDVLRVAAHRGLSDAYIADVENVAMWEGALGRVAATGVPELIDDVTTHPNIVRPAVRREGIHSLVIVPLQARDRVIGAVYVGRRAIQPFTPEQTALLAALGQQVAVAIENASLHGAAVRRSKELSALLRVTRSVIAGLDLQVILQRIVEEAAEIADTPFVQMLLVDERAGVLRATAAVGGASRGTPAIRLGEGLSSLVATDGQPLFVDLRRGLTRRPAEGDLPAGYTTYLGLPIKVRDRVVGVLVFGTVAPHRYSQSSLEYLSSFADQAAIAIESARLFEQIASVEALRELARLKSEFLSTVSHELRTPLSLIVGYSELLTHRAPRLSPVEVADMAAEIGVGSRTMVRLVDDLLDFSRLEQGRLTFRRQWISVSTLLNRLVESFRAQPDGKRIITEVPEGLEAPMDPERITQVINNLLTNALRYAPDGPIYVRAVQLPSDVRIEVSDSGPGIPEAEQLRIWEKFYRGGGAVNSPIRGSGLGLSVVKYLVELHGGAAGVESTLGQGATFWFTLPISPTQLVVQPGEDLATFNASPAPNSQADRPTTLAGLPRQDH